MQLQNDQVNTLFGRSRIVYIFCGRTHNIQRCDISPRVLTHLKTLSMEKLEENTRET